MSVWYCVLILLGLAVTLSLSEVSVIHFQLRRQGLRFIHHEPADLTRLAEALARQEKRYTRTYRKPENNRLIRRWRPEHEEDSMLDEAGLNESWYFAMEIGEPAQSLEINIDMLSPDWFHIMTSSGRGSKYDTFMSKSHMSGNKQVHPLCRISSDVFHLSKSGSKSNLDWPICQSSHSSRHTLRNSGTILGLGPNSKNHPSSLSRLEASSLLNQLYEKDLIPQAVWSVTILDSMTGILSLGGTIAKQMEEAKVRTELELKYLGKQDIQSQQIEDEVSGALSLLGPSVEEQFKWIDVHGAKGWWTGLVSGVWVNGAKILKNQPFLLDISNPFIIAPPSAFTHLYNSIPGSRLPPSHTSTFATFPCLNPPSIAFELGGWTFNLISEIIREDSIHGPTGGSFSLGKVNDMTDAYSLANDTTVNSGYCVGNIVGSQMGRSPEGYTSGMKDMWVLGEPFFRGVGVVFDDGSAGGKARMGFRKY